MNKEKAFSVLGLNSSADSKQIERKFKSLARKCHPDHGGTDKSMAELNEARSVALEHLNSNNSLITYEALQNALVQVQEQQFAQQHLMTKASESRNEMLVRSTNKLRRFRKYALVLAAVSTAILFIGKDLPKDLITMLAPPIDKTHLDASQVQAIEMEIDERGEEYSRMWSVLSLLLAGYAGGCAWYLSYRIDRAELELKDIEENTSTKQLMYRFLSHLLEHHITSQWTLNELILAVERYALLSEHRRLINDIGPFSFAKYLTDRAMAMGLVHAMEVMEEGVLIEHYLLKPITVSRSNAS